MKLHGRITVFGEYLQKDNLSYCACIKSKLFLSNYEDDSAIQHPTYHQSKDGSLKLLISTSGINNLNTLPIYGNLPLGYGMSSSTILSVLHLGSANNKELIVEIDKSTHGFSPSYLDYTSITMQQNGIFGFGKWKPLLDFYPVYSVIILPKEQKFDLSAAKQKIDAFLDSQIKLSNNLYEKLLSTREIEFNIFYDYCKLLFLCGAYSEVATEIAGDMLGKGVSIKCIGGLYDKAVLCIHPDENEKKVYDNYIADTYPFAIIAE